MERKATWYWRIWWWFGYHGLYQINWWLKKKGYLSDELEVRLFKKEGTIVLATFVIMFILGFVTGMLGG